MILIYFLCGINTPNIMKNLLFIIILFFVVTTQAQVGIGTTDPQALLDITAKDNGILIPRVKLQNRTDVKTVVNPSGAALEVGTLAYNTANTTGVGFISEGFVFWDGNQWQRLVPKTEIMFRRLVDNQFPFNDNIAGIGGKGFIFDFGLESFNNIEGASYDVGGQHIVLPTGLYEISGNIRLSGVGNFAYTIDYAPRINGVEIQGSIRGSAAPPNFNSNTSGTELFAIVEITDPTAELDFQISFIAGSGGGPVISDQSYVLIKKIN